MLLSAKRHDPPSRIEERYRNSAHLSAIGAPPFNVTGHPALAVMAGLSSAGVPLSVQFVGRYFAEATLFQVARAWERAAGTNEKHPSLD
jgi:aspartyl-tRNA(Asn)/glutamyl-tRNA(Gln) amidotransferase subunit A